MPNKIYILGHRGYSEVAPENTRLSFELASLYGFDGVEIDVHKTKDGQLVVIHDETVDRTSDGKGHIKDLTLKQLKEMDFSSKFLEGIPFQEILTYEEFLNEFGGKFEYINTEIKTDQIHYKDIEKDIWKVHQKVKPKAKIIYSSFNFYSLELLREISKEALIGFLFVDHKDFKDISDIRVKNTCNYLHPWFKSMLDSKELDFYEKFGLKYNLWTIDRRYPIEDIWVNGSYKKLSELKSVKGVNMLISNSKIV